MPSMGDISERLAWISSERTKKEVIENKVDLFLRPPVSHIGTLEYDRIGKFQSILNCPWVRKIFFSLSNVLSPSFD